ncbi:8-oxo-dGTP pyrophosphatase MutT, NUDIX family [Geosmithia morbida]|uniref:8-oxo-dGTP pyrophosphatase MutT, NUDIX family n=1 Tax=Geosmithia morbida TaxID=1094350 RepID=A0A9P4YST2_9HYPO|nr:8-oxo-dGTP pyrophosphatase MutT, NUDIX family [Geosmithia morbida]KAF4121405.1 8-oxo-dGTP pyrophosphatase MutT, NUDIX family [Geosmithia morbida]
MPPRILVTFMRRACVNPPLGRALASTDASRGAMRKRSVVGSFLFRRLDDGTPHVALFRRSANVNTYQHKYAAVSGGIEAEDATPLDAALREINEETRLTANSVEYLCSGVPWSFFDESLNYQWSVYPFAFSWPVEAEAREELTLGPEHEGYAWFKPNELKEEDLSGGILDSLRRVWPTGDLADIDVLGRYCLGEGATDARRDADAAFDVFRETVGNLNAESEGWWTHVRLAAWHVWNYSDESIRATLLGRLVNGLKKIEGLPREPALQQRVVSVLGDVGGGASTQDAETIFAGLWEKI